MLSGCLQEVCSTAVKTPHPQLGLPQSVPLLDVAACLVQVVWRQVQGCVVHVRVVVLYSNKSVLLVDVVEHFSAHCAAMVLGYVLAEHTRHHVTDAQIHMWQSCSVHQDAQWEQSRMHAACQL